jgi:2-polyprenyl-3-methyl-5-hydroxy-6-metoxy-1,4-benzoquinol methylase
MEIMDDLESHDDVVFQTLSELDFINRWLGGNAITLESLEKLWKSVPKEQPVYIADLGCGSGEMLRLISQKAHRQNRNVVLKGIDANPHIVGYAQSHSRVFNAIQFEALNIFSEEFNTQKFDFIIATLFLHHFSDDELINLFISLKKQARIGIIVNDLHRHPLAYYSIKWLTSLFSKSSMVKYDAPLSVLRAFRRKELALILEKAGIKNYELRWRWAFRWQLIIFLSAELGSQ